ncbi:MAG: hypothetical protein ACOH5I_18370 [Oligoflexus sp.]
MQDMKMLSQTWQLILRSSFVCFSLSTALLGCKAVEESHSKLSSDRVSFNVMLEDEDLDAIERSSLEAFLICDGASRRYKSIIRNNRVAALRGINFRTDQELQAATNCQVEIHGRVKQNSLRQANVDWLSKDRIEGLLYVSKPAPIMTQDSDPAGLGKGYLTSIFYKTFAVKDVNEGTIDATDEGGMISDLKDQLEQAEESSPIATDEPLPTL